MGNRWSEFQSDTYRIEDLGRPAVFLLPSHKLRSRDNGLTVEEDLRFFLLREFGAFTTTTVPHFGVWRDGSSENVHDECRLYEVSFVGKKRIVVLLKKLAEVAVAMSEECIYFKAGQYACLVYPRCEYSKKGGR